MRAFSLADGTYTGQRKVIVHAAGANNAVVTPANLLGAATTITTATAGLSYTLTWLNGDWVLTAIGRAAGITVA